MRIPSHRGRRRQSRLPGKRVVQAGLCRADSPRWLVPLMLSARPTSSSSVVTGQRCPASNCWTNCSGKPPASRSFCWTAGHRQPVKMWLSTNAQIEVIGKSRGSEVLARRLKRRRGLRAYGPNAGRRVHSRGRPGGGAGPNDGLRKTALRLDVSRAYWQNVEAQHHPWRIQHRPPAGFERGSIRDVSCDLRPAAL